MNVKRCIVMFAVSFSVRILGVIIGGFLESSGTVTGETLGSRGITILLPTYFALFCVATFSLVPLALRFFMGMQIKIGNKEFFLIQWLQGDE